MTIASSVARTHVGLVRTVNEDRLLDRPERGLWAVADGMGGHRGGDIAAEMTIEPLRRIADAAERIDGAGVAAAIASANAAIHAEGTRRAATIGSTVVALCYDGGTQGEVLWAGDSRAYLIRDRVATQLTADHSLVQELVEAGALSVDEAGRHPRANVITRALGIEPCVALDRRTVDLVAGDRVLLCSDGLSRTLPPDFAADLGNDDETWASRLLAAALARDGGDNVTFVLVRVLR